MHVSDKRLPKTRHKADADNPKRYFNGKGWVSAASQNKNPRIQAGKNDSKAVAELFAHYVRKYP